MVCDAFPEVAPAEAQAGRALAAQNVRKDEEAQDEYPARGAMKRRRQIYSMIKAKPAAASAAISFCLRVTFVSDQKKICLVASTRA
jgi:hypothetical protein